MLRCWVHTMPGTCVSIVPLPRPGTGAAWTLGGLFGTKSQKMEWDQLVCPCRVEISSYKNWTHFFPAWISSSPRAGKHEVLGRHGKIWGCYQPNTNPPGNSRLMNGLLTTTIPEQSLFPGLFLLRGVGPLDSHGSQSPEIGQYHAHKNGSTIARYFGFDWKIVQRKKRTVHFHHHTS